MSSTPIPLRLSQATYRVIKTSVVKDVEILGKPEISDAADKPPLPEVNVASLKAREERAVNRAIEDVGYIKEGVSVQSQAIFDALRNTCAPNLRSGRMPGAVARCDFMHATDSSPRARP